MKSPATSAEPQRSVHTSAWPLVQLGEILTQRSPDVRVEPTESYQFAGVYSFGRGVFRGPLKKGNEFAYPVLTRLRTGEFVYPKLMAWEGAFGVVPTSCDGFFVSPEFPVFEPDTSRLNPRFLELYFKTSLAWDSLSSGSTGTNVRRRRLHPSQLLRQEIPLLPLEQQNHIVKRLDAATARVVQVREHLATQLADVEKLAIRVHISASGERETALAKVLLLDEDETGVVLDNEYPQVGIKSFGGGLFPKGTLSGSDTTYPTFHKLYSGAVVLSQVKGWEGAIAVCPANLNGWFVSPEYRTFRCRPDELLPDYFAHLCVTSWFWSRLAGASRGAGARRDRVRPELFLQLEIPMPTVDQQRPLLRIFERLDSIRAHAVQITADLDALERSMLAAAFRGELISAESNRKTESPQRPSDARTYLIQFVPAILGASDGSLSLEEISRAYALLFQPDTLRPLIEATGDASARRHFAELPPLDAKVFVQMLRELHRAGVIEQDATTHDLHFGKVSAPPIAAAVVEDARHLAAILSLVPREAVRTMARKLCPHPTRKLFAALT